MFLPFPMKPARGLLFEQIVFAGPKSAAQLLEAVANCDPMNRIKTG
jgi:hypothetical protein